MKRVIGIVFVLSLLACETKKQENTLKIFSYKENAQLGFCMALADSAGIVAALKMKGTSKQKVKAMYDNDSSKGLNAGLIDEVYSMNQPNVWDYRVEVFKGCALKVALIGETKIPYAKVCLNRKALGDMAVSYKEKGRPKEEVYAMIPNNAEVKLIVDDIYANNISHKETMDYLWKPCIDKFTYEIF